MDRDRDGEISLEEFVNCYVEGEIKLKDRLNDIIKSVAERKRQIDDFKERLQDAKVRMSLCNFAQQTEKLNRYGIMENSVLTVHVV